MIVKLLKVDYKDNILKGSKEEYTIMDDVLFVAFCTVMMLILGIVVGSSATKYHYNNRLKSVGIEKIVYCNNVHSNWCEIVWIKK